MGFDSAARDGHRRGKEPRVMYTGLFVHPGGRGGAVPDVRGESQGLKDWFEGPRSWRRPRVEEAGTRNDSGSNHDRPVGRGRARQDWRKVAKKLRRGHESGVVLGETAPSGERQAS